MRPLLGVRCCIEGVPNHEPDRRRPEVLEHFHEIAETTHRDESEIINEALSSYLVADRRYAEILTARMAAADRGEFASEDDVARFFAEHGKRPGYSG